MLIGLYTRHDEPLGNDLERRESCSTVGECRVEWIPGLEAKLVDQAIR